LLDTCLSRVTVTGTLEDPPPLPVFPVAPPELELWATELTALIVPGTVLPSGISTVTWPPMTASLCELGERSTVTTSWVDVVSMIAVPAPPPPADGLGCLLEWVGEFEELEGDFEEPDDDFEELEGDLEELEGDFELVDGVPLFDEWPGLFWWASACCCCLTSCSSAFSVCALRLSPPLAPVVECDGAWDDVLGDGVLPGGLLLGVSVVDCRWVVVVVGVVRAGVVRAGVVCACFFGVVVVSVVVRGGVVVVWVVAAGGVVVVGGVFVGVVVAGVVVGAVAAFVVASVVVVVVVVVAAVVSVAAPVSVVVSRLTNSACGDGSVRATVEPTLPRTVETSCLPGRNTTLPSKILPLWPSPRSYCSSLTAAVVAACQVSSTMIPSGL
jgi:hypothetical protein